MKTRVAIGTLGLLGCALIAALLIAAEPPKGPATTQPGAEKKLDVSRLKISGPFTHENLSIFLLHGPDLIKGRSFLTLQEALKRKKLIVHETGNVGQLTVENVGLVPVYIQSGDILKGGKQDRMCQYDYVIPAKSGKKPISSFCVERGRWSRRGGESARFFGASNNMAVGNRVKLAAKLKGDQGAVWKEASTVQRRLSANTGTDVRDKRSQTSMQLSLENERVKEAAIPYNKKLADLVKKNPDAIGYAAVVNGKVRTVDVYASGALFAKLWPKLLASSVFEAVAAYKKDARFAQPTARDVREFVAEMEKVKATEKLIADKLRLRTRDGSGAASFETYSADLEIHRGYHKKD
ncbi:MAG: ARPP-1 family domain-containing protein [Planctomycetota bacterium]|jgi:hypothetical protein